MSRPEPAAPPGAGPARDAAVGGALAQAVAAAFDDQGPLTQAAEGFRLRDGTRISLVRDWDEAGPRAAFLRDVRDGACRLFATVLSPDYNEAHRDHFHLEATGRGYCR